MKDPELVPQSHGGALLSGGQPGNKGGPGRPPSKVRALAREEFFEAIPELAKIARGGGKRGKKEETADRLRAIDILGKYGLGQARGLDEEQFEGIVLQMASVVQARLNAALPRETADKVLEALFEDWKEILRVHRRTV